MICCANSLNLVWNEVAAQCWNVNGLAEYYFVVFVVLVCIRNAFVDPSRCKREGESPRSLNLVCNEVATYLQNRN